MKKLFENWRKHLKEEAVPHSAHHVVKKMMKTGKSAKETLKSLTTDLSDEEAERWLERHKDEMDNAKKDLDKGRK
jgi:N-acetylmuramic acid 6-phosphate (MurNAc-6-P) etherase